MLAQVWNPEDAEDEVLVMVCRTGMNTTLGSTIRQLLTPTKVYKEKDPFLLVNPSQAFTPSCNHAQHLCLHAMQPVLVELTKMHFSLPKERLGHAFMTLCNALQRCQLPLFSPHNGQ